MRWVGFIAVSTSILVVCGCQKPAPKLAETVYESVSDSTGAPTSPPLSYSFRSDGTFEQRRGEMVMYTSKYEETSTGITLYTAEREPYTEFVKQGDKLIKTYPPETTPSGTHYEKVKPK